MDERQACSVLGVRGGATRAEVDGAYRARLKALRPDLPGHDDGTVLARLRAARDLLRAAGGRERRDPRRRPVAPADPRPLRRSTWLQHEPRPRSVDVLL